MDYNSLVGSNVSKTGSAETSSKDMYVVATGTRDSLEIKKSGELPFLWTEAYKYHSEEGSESNPTCWYGKVRKNSIEINLTELGLTDGDLYTIQCGNTILESNKEYSSSENQNESGDSIYSVSFDNGMSLSPYCLDSENMSSPLYTRTYLLKYLNAPFNIDLKEEYNWPHQMYEYARWNEGLAASKILCVDKAEGKNTYVKLGVSEVSNLDESGEQFKDGVECTNSGQIEYQTRKVFGPVENTKRLFSGVVCRLSTKKNGFTIPIVSDTVKSYVKGADSKHNSGAPDAVVLTRQSRGLKFVNDLYRVVMGSAAIGVVVGAIWGGIVIFGTVTTVAAAIPVVGWAVAAVAALAACIYAMTVFFKGQDQNFSFMAAKGENGKLILPMWGSQDIKYDDVGTISSYMNPNFEKLEEMLMCIATRVYCIHNSGKAGMLVRKNDSDDVRKATNSSLTVTINTNSLYTADENIPMYIQLSKMYDIPLSNFTLSAPLKLTYSIALIDSEDSAEEIINDFNDILESQIGKMESDSLYADGRSYYFGYDRIDGNSDEINAINKDTEYIANHLELATTDDLDSIYFKNLSFKKDQECFGGSRGGCTYDMHATAVPAGNKTRIMSGEFPTSKDGFLPMAYPVIKSSDEAHNFFIKTPEEFEIDYKKYIYNHGENPSDYITWIIGSTNG